MNINKKDIIVYFEKTGVSCLYGTSDSITTCNEILINGEFKTHKSSLFVYEGKIEKIESIKYEYKSEYYLNGELTTNDEINQKRNQHAIKGLKKIGLIEKSQAEEDFDFDDEYHDEVFNAHYLLLRREWESDNKLELKNLKNETFEDITDKYQFMNVVDIEYDKYINTILANNMKNISLEKGLYSVNFSSLYRDRVKEFCDQNNLELEIGKVGTIGEFDKINDTYIARIVGTIPFNSNQYITYEEALSAKNNYLNGLNKKLNLFIADKLKKQEVIKIILTLEHIKGIINYSDVKRASEYKCSAFKSQINDLIKEITLAYDLQEK